MTRRRAFAVTCLVLLLSRPAFAQDASPGEIFGRAEAAFQAQRYREAAELFERALRASPSAQAAYNAGVAWEKAGVRARAATMLARATDLGGLSPDEAERASRIFRALAPTLAKIDLVAPAGSNVRIGDVEAVTPGVVYVDPGTHSVEATLAGGARRQLTVEVGAGETRSLSFEAVEPKPKPEVVAPPAPAPRDWPEARPPAGPSGPPRWLGYASLGVAALAVGGGVALNVRGLSENDAYEDSGRTDLDARQSALDLRTAAFIAYGAGAAFAGAGVVLLLTSTGSKSTARVELLPLGVACRGRF